jgi:hypothetical protein
VFLLLHYSASESNSPTSPTLPTLPRLDFTRARAHEKSWDATLGRSGKVGESDCNAEFGISFPVVCLCSDDTKTAIIILIDRPNALLQHACPRLSPPPGRPPA